MTTGSEGATSQDEGGIVASDGSRALVVIPTYNERENLPRIVSRVQAAMPGVHALVVDNSLSLIHI